MYTTKLLNIFYCPSYPHIFTVAAHPMFLFHFAYFGTSEKMEKP
jgi:hypothetical protein